MKTTALVIGNETYKRLLIIWDYKFNIIMQLLTVVLIFIGATFVLGQGQFRPATIAPMFLGYIVWFYARIVIISTANDLLAETTAGTLEQMYMSPVSTELLLLGRLIAFLVSTTFLTLLPVVGLMLLLHINLPMRWEAIPVLLLTLAGLFGFTLILTGAALVFKQIEALADLVQNVLLFLTGSFVPVNLFPHWLEAFAKTLPITQGIIVLRNVVLGGQSLLSAWNDGSLLWLMLHSTVYVGCGWLIFKYCEHIAKRQGSLGQY